MKLSIITINFNNLLGLKRTIRSVLSQTISPFEWIIIDGGSTDGCKEIIEQNSDNFSYWCSEQDKGIYNAMNKGIEHAAGDYCLFLNSGDELYNNNVLLEFSLFLEKKQGDIIYGDCCFIDKGSIHVQNYVEELSLFSLYFTNISHQATFIRIGLLRTNPYDESYRLVSDFKFWLQSMLQGAVFLHFPYIVCKFYMDGATFSQVDKGKKEREKMLSETIPSPILKSLQEHELLQKENEAYRLKFSRKLPKLFFSVLDKNQKFLTLFTSKT